MPKERRKRTNTHESSVKLSKRQFAVQDNAVEQVEIGGAIEASGTEILDSMNPEPHVALKKKEKHQLKRDAFLQKLETTQSPYSKSHNRRMKRKAKEQIAGGLSDIQAAIEDLDEGIPDSVRQTIGPTAETADADVPKPKSSVRSNKIGEGKGVTLSNAQRKRALQMEQLRHPLILSNPEFSTNPFQTIRTHAQNTLLKHQVPI